MMTLRGGGFLGPLTLIILRAIGIDTQGGNFGGASLIIKASFCCTVGGCVRMIIGGAGGATLP